MKSLFHTLRAALAIACVAGAASAAPIISNVILQQREGTRLMDVWYDLSGGAAIVTLSIETDNVPLPDAVVTRFTGDVSKLVQPGAGRHIVWDAGLEWPEHLTAAVARLTAWPPYAPPQYCAVDLLAGAASTNYPVAYYTSAEAVPGGVTNRLYRTAKLLLRWIEPQGDGTFTMGSPETETGRIAEREAQVAVRLTRGYYIGVYEVTQMQWGNVTDKWTTPRWSKNRDFALDRPAETVAYNQIREGAFTSSDDPAVDWPSNSTVNANSFMGRLRAKTGLDGFDLPTEAQWEYACRAGTAGALNDGTVDLTNEVADARLDLLGRYANNGGGKVWGGVLWEDPPDTATTSNATSTVGTYAPNVWGLYDMHGNVYEWCLDYYADTRVGGDDPKGPSSGTERVLRGGNWCDGAAECRSASRLGRPPRESGSPYPGFRVVLNMEPWNLPGDE